MLIRIVRGWFSSVLEGAAMLRNLIHALLHWRELITMFDGWEE